MKKEYTQERLQSLRNAITNSLWAEHFNIIARLEEGEQRLDSETNESIKELCEDCIKKENKNNNITLELLRKFDSLSNDDFAEIIAILDR